jgi:hypothetical protein
MTTYCNHFHTGYNGRQLDCVEGGTQCPDCALQDAETLIEQLKEPVPDCRTCACVRHDYHNRYCRSRVKCVNGSEYEFQKDYEPHWMKNE